MGGKRKPAVLLDCFGQFLTNTNVKQSVRIDWFFNVFESSSHHELVAFEGLTAHWIDRPLHSPL